MEYEEVENMNEKIAADLYVAATQYCTFLEHVADFSQEQIFDYLLKVLPLVYIKGGLLHAGDDDEFSASEQSVTEEEYEAIYLGVKSKLESVDYFENYDLASGDTQSVSLCEYLADIYQDLKDFVLLYSKNTITARLSAAYLCRLRYACGWGKKILAVLQYVHALAYQEENNEELY